LGSHDPAVAFGMPQPAAEVSILREQMINFLQATVIFLLITNAFTITAAVCAIRLLTGAPLEKRRAAGAIGQAFLGPLPHGRETSEKLA